METHLVCCKRSADDATADEHVFGGNKVLLAATELFRCLGMSAYHTSIILGHRELFFDAAGIMEADAFWSHKWCKERCKGATGTALQPEVFEMGWTALNGECVKHALSPHFQGGSYDILRKNCNTFADVCLNYLTSKRLEGRFSRLERTVLAFEPVSTDLMSRLCTVSTKSASASRRLDTNQTNTAFTYVSNPLASGFNIEDVITACGSANRDVISDDAEGTLRFEFAQRHHSPSFGPPSAWKRRFASVDQDSILTDCATETHLSESSPSSTCSLFRKPRCCFSTKADDHPPRTDDFQHVSFMEACIDDEIWDIDAEMIDQPLKETTVSVQQSFSKRASIPSAFRSLQISGE